MDALGQFKLCRSDEAKKNIGVADVCFVLVRSKEREDFVVVTSGSEDGEWSSDVAPWKFLRRVVPPSNKNSLSPA